MKWKSAGTLFHGLAEGNLKKLTHLYLIPSWERSRISQRIKILSMGEKKIISKQITEGTSHLRNRLFLSSEAEMEG